MENGNGNDAESEVLRAGFMEKRAAIDCESKKRWFVLRSNGTMLYLVNPADSKPRGCCDLSTMTKIEKTGPKTFELTTTDREWAFRTLNETQCDEWFGAIRSLDVTEHGMSWNGVPSQ